MSNYYTHDRRDPSSFLSSWINYLARDFTEIHPNPLFSPCIWDEDPLLSDARTLTAPDAENRVDIGLVDDDSSSAIDNVDDRDDSPDIDSVHDDRDEDWIEPRSRKRRKVEVCSSTRQPGAEDTQAKCLNSAGSPSEELVKKKRLPQRKCRHRKKRRVAAKHDLPCPRQKHDLPNQSSRIENALTGRFVSIATYGQDLTNNPPIPYYLSVGTIVRKEFPPHGTFDGQVVAITNGLYRVVYADGDSEDLGPVEVGRYHQVAAQHYRIHQPPGAIALC